MLDWINRNPACKCWAGKKGCVYIMAGLIATFACIIAIINIILMIILDR